MTTRRRCPTCGGRKDFYAKLCRRCSPRLRPLLGRRGPNHPAWKGGTQIDRDGYLKTYAPDHPWPRRGGYVRENGADGDEVRRSRPAPRARVVSARPLSNQERGHLTRLEKLLRGPRYAGLLVVLPDRRSHCVNVPRPCPFVSCTKNNYLDVTPTGAIKLNFPHLEPGEMDPELSCADDIGDRGGVPLEVVGQAQNVSMERARQVVEIALKKGKAVVRREDVEIDVDGDDG